MKPITPDELREDFADIIDSDERLEYIIEFGDELPEMSSEFRVEDNRVQGCVSNVWVIAEVKSDAQSAVPATVHFQADSDAVITRGLVAILVGLLSGKAAQEILDLDIDGLFADLDLNSHLTRSRSNGLRNMVRRVRGLAEAALNS